MARTVSDIALFMQVIAGPHQLLALELRIADHLAGPWRETFAGMIVVSA